MLQKDPEIIVVKIGSSTLSASDGALDIAFMEEFVEGLSRLHADGRRVILVSSGAVRTGAPVLGLPASGLSVIEKQAAAAVGQGLLIARYIELFSQFGIPAAQVLLTAEVINDRKMYLNAHGTLRTLIDYRAVPVINENDTVSSEGIRFGDNDTLSAIAALLVDADLLILLSDIEGLYDSDPRKNPDAKLISEVTAITSDITGAAGGPGTLGAAGGMTTKIKAAQAAVESGIRMVIANGREPNIVERIVAGEKAGTTFLPGETRYTGKRKWLAYGCRSEGRIIINDGAGNAIVKNGKSLLPKGVVGTAGPFEYGACVDVVTEDGTIIAKGITAYSALEISHIMGRHSSEIESILSFKIADEIIHRDDMALL